MRIQHNIMAMNSYRNLGMNNRALAGNLEKLSSGYKINRAGDDAAGLAISEKMRAQITALDAAQKNVNDGISLVKTAEGAMQEIQDMLNRMEYLATQSANGTYDNEVDRDNLQKEVDALKSEINRIADASNFNGTKLLDGSLGGYGLGNEPLATTTGKNEAGLTAINISGGNLENTGVVKLSFAAANNSESVLTIATDTVNKTGGTAFDKADYTIVDQDGNEFTSGTSKVKANTSYTLTLKAKSTASVAEANAFDGLTISFTTGALPADAKASTFTVTADANGNIGDGLKLQIGDTSDDYNQLTVKVGDMHTKAMGTKGGKSIADIDISSQAGAAEAVKVIKDAINYVSGVRGDLGAVQNRLEHTNNNLAVMEENIQDAESTIRDTDIADEMMAYTKNNILIQSAQAMLAQANQVPQGVLQLMQ